MYLNGTQHNVLLRQQYSDHGFDCICTLFHIATCSSYFNNGGTYWYIAVQTSLQLAFFMAQWVSDVICCLSITFFSLLKLIIESVSYPAKKEEYHTHVLPHCVGGFFGTTEVNYALGLIAIIMGCVDREVFFMRSFKDFMGPLAGDFILQHIPDAVKESELRNVAVGGWLAVSTVLMILSIGRVLKHPRVAPPSASTFEVFQGRMNAMSKLLSPALLCVAGFVVPPTAVRTRYLSVTLGLSFSILTKKMIVFSMAKMPFAAIQWDAVPLWLMAIWIRFDENLTKMGADFVLGLLCFYYAWRLLHWANITIDQICAKLDINCFTIKKKKAD